MSEPKEPTPPSPLEMDSDEMRRIGYLVVDRIVARWATLGEDRAWGFGTRKELEPLVDGSPPEEGRDPEKVLEGVLENTLPYAGRIDHPRFFAFIPSSPTWPSVMGDLLATGFNVFEGTWLESAGPSQLELVVIDWFREWLGFPEEGGGLFTSGGSAANLCALVAAREAAGNPSDPTIYVSDQGHSSLERAARIIGIPQEHVRKVPTDPFFRMDMDQLAEVVGRDRDLGMSPLCLCGNAGATNTGAVDPLDAMASFAEEEGLWFHVDGAYGGFAILVPGERVTFRGLERADSVTLDPHKWLFQPYETGCLMVRETRILEDAFRILPEYLQDAELGKEQVNFADRGLQLSRGFRALKVWMSIQTLGLRAFREAIATAIAHARRAAEYIAASPHLELTGPPSLGMVCFRFIPTKGSWGEEELEKLNRSIQDQVNESGVAMMSSTRLRGVFSLRVAVLNFRSTWEDVHTTLQEVERVGQARATGRAES